MDDKKQKCIERTKRLILFLSLGKYRTPLYYKGKDNYSSIISGVLSLLFSIGMIAITITIFIPIFRKEEYQLEKKTFPLYRIILDDAGNETA
jgi:hypothetical protein